MDKLVTMLFVVLFVMTALIQFSDITTYNSTASNLKEDLDLAVHDASIQVDEDFLSQGVVKIQAEKAEETFRSTFEENSGLDEGDYDIVDFKVFDQTNANFPVNYSPSSTQFTETYQSPTVVAVVDTTTSDYFIHSDSDRTMQKVASYSYKLKDELQGQGASLAMMNTMSASSVPSLEGKGANEYGLHWTVPSTTATTSPFDPNRLHPIKGYRRPHNGVDISDGNVFNKPAVSAKDGVVTFSGVKGSMTSSFGNLVIIDHGGGVETYYGHLNKRAVSVGDKVEGGDVIGLIGSTGGSTGPHLHYEVRIDGTPVDPMKFYP